MKGLTGGTVPNGSHGQEVELLIGENYNRRVIESQAKSEGWADVLLSHLLATLRECRRVGPLRAAPLQLRRNGEVEVLGTVRGPLIRGSGGRTKSE